jgi:flagellar motor switch protein FliM
MSPSKAILSPDEVDALVEGVESGDINVTPMTDGPMGASIQPYSLFATDTTSRSQLSTIDMINDRLSRQLRGNLLTLLRQAVKLTPKPFEVTTFGNYIRSVPAPCNVNIIRYAPLPGYGLITIEPTLVYGAVDSFFGGRGDGTAELPASRGFTPTEERIIQLLLEGIFRDLKEAWQPVYGIEPEFMSREINPAFAQIGEEREIVIVSTFALELGANARGNITIMYPFSALKPIRLLLRGRTPTGERDEKQAQQWSHDLLDAVKDSAVVVTAELATVKVSALDLATIKVGDTLWLKPDEHLKVLVQGSHVFQAEYGDSNGNAAIRIAEILTPELETPPMAQAS